jgi:2,3-diketo-5-methylthio-1-phosphopentane phosphatase
MKGRLRLFIDFDGTITQNDVGDALITTFSVFEPLHSQLLDGRFSVAEYYRRAAELFRSDVAPHDVVAFARSQEVDPYFMALCAWCAEHDVEMTIVSDGFDVYIDPILEHIGAEALPRFCNTLVYDGVSWTASFPGASESCSCFCASCKRNVLLTISGPDDVIIYVGDGRSDTCAAEHADIVFAKGTLARYCEANGIAHHHFRSLFTVQQILDRRLRDNDMRARKQAERLRQRAIQSE